MAVGTAGHQMLKNCKTQKIKINHAVHPVARGSGMASASALEAVFTQQLDVMCGVLAPMLDTDTLIALCVASATIRRTWLASPKWQTQLRLCQRFARQFGWTFSRTRQCNPLRVALRRIGWRMPAAGAGTRQQWWCMGGCGALIDGTSQLVNRVICRRTTCIGCLCRRAVAAGNELIIGCDAIVARHREWIMHWLPSTVVWVTPTHRLNPPLALYMPSENKQLFRVYETDVRTQQYAAWNSDIQWAAKLQAVELEHAVH